MMTKRRAENSPLSESPHRKRKTICDAERALEAVHAVAAPPALFPCLIGKRRRKRPRCCEDSEQHDKTEAQGGKSGNTTDAEKKESAFGKLPGASEMASEEIKVDKRAETQHPDDGEDELCAFNSFQFWRTPLPALDLSLLDAASAPALSEDTSLKDGTEDMET